MRCPCPWRTVTFAAVRHFIGQTISIHTVRGGWRRVHHLGRLRPKNHFNPRRPRRTATRYGLVFGSLWMHFNPRHPWRVATAAAQRCWPASRHFNPRHPWRVATLLRLCGRQVGTDFNPRHPWRVATLDLLHVLRHLVKFQSTPPVEGGDCATLTVTRYTEYFNPRHPWRVATVRPPSKKSKHGSFQSTPPVEGGDVKLPKRWAVTDEISIHATRGGWRQDHVKPKFPVLTISIHATRGGWRLSCGREVVWSADISIHATRGGWRQIKQSNPAPAVYFNPRHPWRVATRPQNQSVCRCDFNPRHPWRVATAASAPVRTTDTDFNPRHPWRVATEPGRTDQSKPANFNPRHPWRVATGGRVHGVAVPSRISIHATRGGWRLRLGRR